jgi:hypothetical protein
VLRLRDAAKHVEADKALVILTRAVEDMEALA